MDFSGFPVNSFCYPLTEYTYIVHIYTGTLVGQLRLRVNVYSHVSFSIFGLLILWDLFHTRFLSFYRRTKVSYPLPFLGYDPRPVSNHSTLSHWLGKVKRTFEGRIVIFRTRGLWGAKICGDLRPVRSYQPVRYYFFVPFCKKDFSFLRLKVPPLLLVVVGSVLSRLDSSRVTYPPVTPVLFLTTLRYPIRDPTCNIRYSTEKSSSYLMSVENSCTKQNIEKISRSFYRIRFWFVRVGTPRQTPRTNKS